jgi:hypothetical protein
MTFIVRVHAGPDYLQVDGAGPADLAELCGYMDLVGTVAARKGHTHAVLNLLDVEIALSFTDHLQLGAHAAQQLRNLKRVASVVPERFRTGTSEKAAQKSGLQLRTFTSLVEGLTWLASEAQPASRLT